METNKLQFPPIEKEGLRVLTTSQLAEAYGTKSEIITKNFNRNKKRYKEGVHYFKLTGEALKEFKRTTSQIDFSSSRINVLYLWTERGALLHAKSLNTEKAWEVYEFLIDNYYRAREIIAYQNNALLQQNEYSSSGLPMVADEVKTLCDKIERLSKEFNLLKEENRDFKQMCKQNQTEIYFLKENFKELNKEKEQLQLENREFTKILKIKCEDIYHLKEKNQMYYEDIYFLKEEVKVLKKENEKLDKVIALLKKI